MLNSWGKHILMYTLILVLAIGQKVLEESEFLKQAVACRFNLEIST